MPDPAPEATDHALLSTSTGVLAGLSVIATPDLKADLSAPVLVIANALDTGLGSALGGKSLTDMGLTKLADLAGSLSEVMGESLSSVIADVAGMVPFVGTLFSAALKIFNAFGNVPSPAEKCQHFLSAFAPRPSGSILVSSGQPFVPADYFARVIDARTAGPLGKGAPAPYVTFIPSDGLFRSALGMALMAVTEGAPIDADDLSEDDWLSGTSPSTNPGPGPYAADLLKLEVVSARGKKVVRTGKTYGELHKKLLGHTLTLPFDRRAKATANAMKLIWQRRVDNNYRMWTALWRNDYYPEKTSKDPGRRARGLPRKWRLRFRALRRGIEATYMHSGDGGALLWLLYVDLLGQAFDRGYLSTPFVEHMIFHGCESSATPFGTFGVCGPYVAKSIEAIAVNWQHTIRPYYDQGAAKIAEVKARLGSDPAGSKPEEAKAEEAAMRLEAPAQRAASSPAVVSPLLVGAGVVGGVALLLHFVGGRRN